jgi:hypothetical protein
MVIFHSYVSLPEGGFQFSLRRASKSDGEKVSACRKKLEDPTSGESGCDLSHFLGSPMFDGQLQSFDE